MGQSPADTVLAIGYRTLFEKRFFREALGLPDPEFPDAPDSIAETRDPLVRFGADVFFNQEFEGNSRTCGTCHVAENNLTIDREFIAGLDPSDPLFVATNETDDLDLDELENPVLLADHGLILENVDGLEDPTNKFVMRSVNHTFAMSTSINRGGDPARPPDERLGWGGDGSPGRGTLMEFAIGAVNQHLTRSLGRVPGVDFRVPTQQELDSLEAFQLFSGRQTEVDVAALEFKEPRANSGQALFNAQGACFLCHGNAGSNNLFTDVNFNFNTGVEDRDTAVFLGLPPGTLPLDGGFGGDELVAGSQIFGNKEFSTPPLIEAADTAPFFHNNSGPTLEAAIEHYTLQIFRDASGFNIELDGEEIGDIGVFLRVLNVAENIRQVRKRVEFVLNNRTAGNTAILGVAIADSGDVLRVLLERQNLHADVQHDMATAKVILEMAQLYPDDFRAPLMDIILDWLDLAKGRLFSQNPNDEF